MRYYIATRLENKWQHRQLVSLLKPHGHELTYDWTEHGSVHEQPVERIREVATLEVNGVASADVVIVLLPGGRGTHVELGLGIAGNKHVIIWAANDGFFQCDQRTCAFYHHPSVVTVIGPLGDLSAALNKLQHERANHADLNHERDTV